jgi:hypothetical protein
VEKAPGSEWERRRNVFARGAGDRVSILINAQFLAERNEHPPALLAVFGFAEEPEPGSLRIDSRAIAGVHLTRLLPDGSGKAGEPSKIMIGRSSRVQIVLSPPNDSLGLVIAEGIEDALSAYQATGLGAWAAGSASRLPALADKVPPYMDCVTVVVDPDDAGRKFAAELAGRLLARGIYTELSEGSG